MIVIRVSGSFNIERGDSQEKSATNPMKDKSMPRTLLLLLDFLLPDWGPHRIHLSTPSAVAAAAPSFFRQTARQTVVAFVAL